MENSTSIQPRKDLPNSSQPTPEPPWGQVNIYENLQRSPRPTRQRRAVGRDESRIFYSYAQRGEFTKAQAHWRRNRARRQRDKVQLSTSDGFHGRVDGCKKCTAGRNVDCTTFSLLAYFSWRSFHFSMRASNFRCTTRIIRGRIYWWYSKPNNRLLHILLR